MALLQGEFCFSRKISSYNSLKIFEDTLTTNKFKTSVMDIYMAYEASEGVCIESPSFE